MVEPKAFQDALLAYHARPCDPEAEAVRAAVLEQVAAMLDNKADDYGMEHGHVDGETGAVEFGRGWRGEVKEDHYNDLRELADEVRGMKRAAGVAACIPTLPMSEVSGVVFVFHPEDPMLQLLPEGTHVVLQRRIPTPKDGVAGTPEPKESGNA